MQKSYKAKMREKKREEKNKSWVVLKEAGTHFGDAFRFGFVYLLKNKNEKMRKKKKRSKRRKKKKGEMWNPMQDDDVNKGTIIFFGEKRIRIRIRNENC